MIPEESAAHQVGSQQGDPFACADATIGSIVIKQTLDAPLSEPYTSFFSTSSCELGIEGCQASLSSLSDIQGAEDIPLPLTPNEEEPVSSDIQEYHIIENRLWSHASAGLLNDDGHEYMGMLFVVMHLGRHIIDSIYF